jgi:hypothetical protein
LAIARGIAEAESSTGHAAEEVFSPVLRRSPKLRCKSRIAEQEIEAIGDYIALRVPVSR